MTMARAHLVDPSVIPSRNSAPMSSICRALAEGVLIRVFPSKRITKAV
jgi:hypothetical protein